MFLRIRFFFLFSGDGLLGDEWEEQKIEAELEKRGYSIDHKSLPPSDELDIDEHLNLKEMEKRPSYNEQDLV